MKTRTWYDLLIGTNECPQKSADTEEELKVFALKEYRNRDKKDGNDDYWRSKKITIVKVIKLTETVFTI